MLNWFGEINSNTYNFDKGKKLCYYVIIFLIGSLIGFMYEEIFYFIFENTLSKRGFLYGPYLPVYGFGSVLIVLFLKKIAML